METILGLDLGANSIGWALITSDGGAFNEIIRMGSRVFPEGVDRTNTGAEISKNEARRRARGARRQRRRRNERKKRLLTQLQALGMAPSEAERSVWEGMEPYALRTKGLDEQLSLMEFGRALYHLNMRRGFSSNRRTSKDTEDGVVKTGISETKELVKSTNSRTVGEMLNKVPEQLKKRDRYVDRADYIEEFDLLWDKQSTYYPQVLTAELKTEIKQKTIFFQRKLHSQAHLIGKCSLEKNKKRIPKAHLLFQEFRLWQTLNNLEAKDETGDEFPLAYEHLKLIYEAANKTSKLSYNAIRKLLGWPKIIRFNLEMGGEKDLPGNTTNHRLAHEKAFGSAWYDFDEAFRNHVVDVLIYVESEEKVKQLALEKWGCSEEQAEFLSKTNLEADYGSYSKKAIGKLLKYLHQGSLLSEAIVKADYKIEVDGGEGVMQLPMPKRLPNPLVNQALIELRKVVNNIIRVYGKPDVIRIEMARDLKSSSKQREEMKFENAKNRKINEAAVKALREEFGIDEPTRDDVLWYKLWEECKHVCPYTGMTIAKHHLKTGEFQVEHILPYSRSLDDSYMNKTLCHHLENRKKGNKTPYEAYAHTDEWDEMLQRIRSLPEGKKRKFRQEELSMDEFISRQLNDTRYISREALAYMKQLGVEVTVCTGMTTSHLRRHWGLNSIIKSDSEVKDRSDHRHHAIDALVVALTDRGMLQKLSRTHGEGKELPERLPYPAPDFRTKVKQKVDEIIVSYRPTRDLKGALHEETFYGITGMQDERGQELYVVRKAVHGLTDKEMKQIRDPFIRDLLAKELEVRKMRYGAGTALKSFETEPLMIKDKTGERPVRKVRILKPLNNVHKFKDKYENHYKAVQYGNNHHVVIFEYEDEKGRTKRRGEVVTMLEAARRAKAGLPVINRDQPELGRFVMSLIANDMVQLEDGEVYRVQKMVSDGRIMFRHHTVTLSGDSDPGVFRASASVFTGKKVTISPLGDISEAND